MPSNRGRLVVAFAGALILVVGFGSAPARAATTWKFPSACNGADSLQHCIDTVAQSGDTIEIDTDTPIAGTATIKKSLTLTSAAGFHGTITGGVQVTASSGAVHVVLHDLSFDGSLYAYLTGGSGHTLSVDHVSVTNGSTPGAPGVRFETLVPASFDVTASRFHIVNGQAPQMYLEAANDTGSAAFRVVGDHMDGHGNAQSFGGIQLILDGSGSARADILNNVVWDVGACGCVGGAGVYYRVNEPGNDDVNVVGNTFDHAVYGVNIQTVTTAGGSYSLDLFDNIISHTNGQPGVNIDSFTNPAEFRLRAGNNDFFDLDQPNDFNGYPSGTGNKTADPMFRDLATGNLRLKSSSPLIDRGVVCSPGGFENLDAAGHARLDGPSVDMGAYERGATAATGRAFVGTGEKDTFSGTPGQDVLCGYNGADTLKGKRGDDYVDGGGGSDIVIGGPGADRMFGGSGRDSVCGHDGVHANDFLDGGTQDDDFSADPGDVRVHVEHPGC